MKLKHTILSLVLLFSALRSFAATGNGLDEVKDIVTTFNKRIEKTGFREGFFMVLQDKETDGINSFKIYFYTYTKKDKKLAYQLSANNESENGHFYASVIEDGKVLKIQYSIADNKFEYQVKMVDDVLVVFDDKGTQLFPSASDMPAKPAADHGSKTAVTIAEVMPKPAFDIGAYLGDNLHYPEMARQKNKEGRVLVKFVVNEDGSISDVELMKGFNDECDKEAMRVVRNMPKWIPGKVDGKNVKVYFTLPLRFKLTN